MEAVEPLDGRWPFIRRIACNFDRLTASSDTQRRLLSEAAPAGEMKAYVVIGDKRADASTGSTG